MIISISDPVSDGDSDLTPDDIDNANHSYSPRSPSFASLLVFCLFWLWFANIVWSSLVYIPIQTQKVVKKYGFYIIRFHAKDCAPMNSFSYLQYLVVFCSCLSHYNRYPFIDPLTLIVLGDVKNPHFRFFFKLLMFAQ